MVLFFALFVAIFARVSAWERDPVASRVRLVSQQSADKIEAGLDEQAAFLDQLERSFARLAPFSRQVFRSLVERLTRRFPIIQAVEWSPRVSAVERASFEAARRGEISGFTIRERDPSGKMRLADARAQYYPVTYVEPLTDNDEVVGFDLASEAARRTAIETSPTSDGVIATAPGAWGAIRYAPRARARRGRKRSGRHPCRVAHGRLPWRACRFGTCGDQRPGH
jgi:CHASE1-domain containing sensor protein